MVLKDFIYLLLIVTYCVQYIMADDLTEDEMKQLCSNKYLEAIAYPGKTDSFILCLNDKPQLGVCKPTAMPNSKPTCFNEKTQNCTVDCSVNNGNKLYFDYIQNYCATNELWLSPVPADDCFHYYVCLGAENAPVYDTCPKGLHFSREQAKCMTPVEAACESLNGICAHSADGFRIAAPNSCYEYYECKAKKAQRISCQFGEHFDALSATCIDDTQSQCVDETVRKPNCTQDDNGLYYPHSVCNKFYVCLNAVPFEAQCGRGDFFDKKALVCRKDVSGICK